MRKEERVLANTPTKRHSRFIKTNSIQKRGEKEKNGSKKTNSIK